MTEAVPVSLIQAEPISSSAFLPYGDIVENKTAQSRRDVPLAFKTNGVELTPEMWVNRLPRHGLTRALIDVLESHLYSGTSWGLEPNFLPFLSRRKFPFPELGSDPQAFAARAPLLRITPK